MGSEHRGPSVPSRVMPHAPLRPDPAGEADLLGRLRAGDPTAYEVMVRTRGGRLLVVARRYLASEEDARDAVQETFVSAWRGMAGFAEASSLSTWLHRILVNACLMRLRRRRRKPEESLDALLPTFDARGHHARPVSRWNLSADAALQGEQARRVVRQAIDRLPETYRTVILLRDIDQCDTEEAAELLGVTPNAVKIRLHRAHQALKTLLDPHLAELRPT